MDLDDKKKIKAGIIYVSFKQALESTETTVNFGDVTLIVGTTNDKQAYQDV